MSTEERALLQKPEEGWGQGEAKWAIKRSDGLIEIMEPVEKILVPNAPGWENLTMAQQEWCTLLHQRSKKVSEQNKKGTSSC